MSTVGFPPLSIFPEYLKGGGGHHSNDGGDDELVTFGESGNRRIITDTEADIVALPGTGGEESFDQSDFIHRRRSRPAPHSRRDFAALSSTAFT